MLHRYIDRDLAARATNTWREPTGPMCRDCYRARETDNEIWASELYEEDDTFDR